MKRLAGQALTYLVFQGDTVREDDVIFHCSDGYIQADSRERAPFEDSARPYNTTGDWTNWEKDG